MRTRRLVRLLRAAMRVFAVVMSRHPRPLPVEPLVTLALVRS
nr:MAG TPA: hypothetical protein [Caudoviricetes sp.]